MTCKFLHVRQLDEQGDISPFGGLTVVYSIVDTIAVAGVCVNLAKCHPDDRFCFETGRLLASKKLFEEGPLDVLTLDHPISFAIVDWVANKWLPTRRKYGGYAVDIWPDDKHRWVSNFTPSQQYIEGEVP